MQPFPGAQPGQFQPSHLTSTSIKLRLLDSPSTPLLASFPRSQSQCLTPTGMATFYTYYPAPRRRPLKHPPLALSISIPSTYESFRVPDSLRD